MVMYTDELDDNCDDWEDDPNNCLECAKARSCLTAFFYANREYPKDGTHCECGHVTMGSLIGTTAAEEEEKAGRIPHTKICTNHWIAYMDNIIDEENARQN